MSGGTYQIFTAGRAVRHLSFMAGRDGGAMDDAVRNNNDESDADHTGLSRRQVLAAAGGTGLLAAVGPAVLRAPAAQAAPRAAQQATPGGGTPEQVHLTWGADPATSVVVSWATPGQAVAPRVLLDGPGTARRVVPALARSYTDGLNGETVYTLSLIHI